MTATAAVGTQPTEMHSCSYLRLLFVFSRSMSYEIQIAAPDFKDYDFSLRVIESETSKESNRDNGDWCSYLSS